MVRLMIQTMSFDANLVSSKQELIDMCLKAIEQKQKGYFTAVNPEKLLHTSGKKHLSRMYDSSIANFADGVGITVAARFLNGQKIERITGVDFFFAILSLLEKKQGRIFLFGSEPEVLQKTIQQIDKHFPSIHIAGSQSGFDFDNEKLIAQINASQPDVIAVALGSPKQEEWIMNQGMRAITGVYIGVGGSFDIIAGHVKRAPKIFQRLGMEWLYRLVAQPSRGKRQKMLPVFVSLLLKEKCCRLFSSSRA